MLHTKQNWFLACTKHSYCASGIRSARRKVFSWWNSELLASPGIMMLVQSFPPPAIFSPLPDPSFCRKRKSFYWFVKKNLNSKIGILLLFHSSEIRGLCLTKCSSETLQNLLYFMYKKTHVVFFVFHFVRLYIFT